MCAKFKPAMQNNCCFKKLYIEKMRGLVYSTICVQQVKPKRPTKKKVKMFFNEKKKI